MFRPFSFVINALFHWVTLQTVINHNFLRSEEEGGSVEPLYNKGLTKLHFVLFA